MKYGQKYGGKSRKIGLTLSSGSCRILISSQKGRKLAPQQKVLKQLCWDLLCWGWKSHFFQKIAFFGQKMRFFQKNYFIQNWSVIKTTSCAHAKKYIFKIKFWDCNFHQILPIYAVCSRENKFYQTTYNYTVIISTATKRSSFFSGKIALYWLQWTFNAIVMY